MSMAETQHQARHEALDAARHDLIVEPDGTTLISGLADGATVRLAAHPDVASARRWLRTFRAIAAVRLTITRDGVEVVIVGVGSRLPMSRRISASTGLGLVQLGVPLVVRRVSR